MRPYETSLTVRDQIRIKAVQEDEELLCIVWAKTGDVSGHTILRNGSTHSYIAPSLAWDIHRGPVANNITPTSSALGQVEASFIHKHEDVRGLVSFQCHYCLQYKKHQISHTVESYTRVTDNYIGMFYVLLHKFNILLATSPMVPSLGYLYP